MATIITGVIAKGQGGAPPGPTPPSAQPGREITTKNDYSIFCGVGTAYGWGDNTYGQIGNNTTGTQRSPALVCAGGFIYSHVTAGYYHSAGFDSGYRSLSWGSNNYGQLGINSTTDKSTPTCVVGGFFKYSQISAGRQHSVAIYDTYNNDFNGYAWGRNTYGQLGNGDTTDQSSPTLIYGGLSFNQLEAGENHTLGLTTDGDLYAWGYNAEGQLGNDSVVDVSTPIAVCSGITFHQVSANKHSLGRSWDNNIYGWGLNDFGQLGDNTTTNKSTPILILTGTTPIDISAGQYHTLALNYGGSQIYSWGNNTYGQLGDNTSTNKSVPVSVCNGITFAKISVGTFHVLGIDVKGTLWAWGNPGQNMYGILGVNSSNCYVSMPIPVCMPYSVYEISAGDNYSLCVTTDGVAYAWGLNNYGQLGDNTTLNRSTPVAVCNGNSVKQVCAGLNYSFIIKQDGTAYGFGYNFIGQLGDNTTTCRSSPVAVCGGLTFLQISAGGGQSLGITNTGIAYAWGYNEYGQLGDNTTTSRLTPVAICGGLTFSQISAGYAHSLGITTTGIAYAWGNNNNGYLGDNTTLNRSTPVAVCGGLTFTQISAGYFSSSCITMNGDAYAWGLNDVGQLGNGTTNYAYSTPGAVCGGLKYQQLSVVLNSDNSGYTDVLGLTREGFVYSWGYYIQLDYSQSTVPVINANLQHSFSQISAGQYHSLGFYYNDVYGWGYNSSGQLGVNNRQTIPVKPACVSSLGTVEVFAFKQQTTISMINGTGYAWGLSAGGALGNNSFGDTKTPVQISGNRSYIFMDNNLYNGAGIEATTLDLYMWGPNDYGNLGNNTTVESRTPIKVCGGLSFSMVAVGFSHTLGLTTTGALYAWGRNNLGQLGDGTTTNKSTPVAICAGTTFTDISANWDSSYAVTNTGTGYAWGDNSQRQLGDGTGTNRCVPTAICGGITFTKISAGYLFALGMDATKVYGWGYNNYGTLGLGYITNYESIPKAVSRFWSTPSKISAGYSHSMAEDSTGVYTWGYNEYGELGVGSYSRYFTPVKVISDLIGAGATVNIQGGQYCSAIQTSDNILLYFGLSSTDNFTGSKFGDNNEFAYIPMPFKIPIP